MALNGSEGTERDWSRATKDAMKAARASRLMALKRDAVREGAHAGHHGGDGAYMRSVANKKDGGLRWCQPLVPVSNPGGIASG